MGKLDSSVYPAAYLDELRRVARRIVIDASVAIADGAHHDAARRSLMPDAMGHSRIIRVVTAVLALLLVALGLWALIAPHSFYENAATYPPYNRHLVHDVGALAIGLGSCLAAGLLVRDALLAVLAGNTIGAAAHFVSHVLDRSLGGNASDPVTFGILALVFAALTLARWLRGAETARD